MKLLACISDKYAVFSVGHHDYCRAPDGTMADGGQPGLQDYAGYTRFSRRPVWIELPKVTFAQLKGDYNRGGKRRFGIHKLSSVRVLKKNETPAVDSFEWKVENFVWGTRGKNGDKPLKYILLTKASTSHLKAILDYLPATQEEPLVKKVVKHILQTRNGH